MLLLLRSTRSHTPLSPMRHHHLDAIPPPPTTTPLPPAPSPFKTPPLPHSTPHHLHPIAATLYTTAGFPTFAATLVTSSPQPHEPPPPSSYRMGVFVSVFPQGAFGFVLAAKGAFVCGSNSRLGPFVFLLGTKGLRVRLDRGLELRVRLAV
nr:hypothetical protein [Tanacetum cinerariifolium]